MYTNQYISVKSRIGVEFRRYALRRDEIANFDDFYKMMEKLHELDGIPFVISYTDPQNCLLPINNNENLAKAISSAIYTCMLDNNLNSSHYTNNNNYILNNNYNNNNQEMIKDENFFAKGPRPLLKLFIENKRTFVAQQQYTTSGTCTTSSLTRGTKKRHHLKGLTNLISASSSSSSDCYDINGGITHITDRNGTRPSIGMPEDFRQVSSIIDVDVVPETCRRVRLVKHGSDKPLGFYIRDGTSIRVTPQGLEKVSGIFISRLVPGGLAESAGVLGVNDEVLEVNGIAAHGKTLDQVTDMMVANSSNLIITIRPACQACPYSCHSHPSNTLPRSHTHPHLKNNHDNNNRKNNDTSSPGSLSDHDHDEDQDEIRDHLDKL